MCSLPFSLNLISPVDHLVVAVSGGPDSMALLHYLLMLRESTKYQDLKIIVAHINHHTRVGENEAEEALISTYCQQHALPFYRADYVHSGQDNFHQAAREFRYQFFFEVAKQVSAHKIVLAHHLDDQVETVLLKMLRGANLSGYAGMKDAYIFKDGIMIVRPLLHVSKQEILDYCKINQVPYLVDSSNNSDAYTRNKLRHEVLPKLNELQSDAKEKITQFATQVAEASEFIDAYANQLFMKYHQLNTHGQVLFKINDLQKLDKVILRRLFTLAVNLVSDNQLEVSFKQLNAMMSLLENDKPNILINLADNFRVIKQYNELVFTRQVETLSDYQIEINEFKEYILPNQVKLNVKKLCEIVKFHNKCLVLCYNKSMWPLYVRTPKPGDRIQTKVGHKKVNRIFINHKIPKLERAKWPIITDKNDQILWVVGLEKSNLIDNLEGQCYIYIEVK